MSILNRAELLLQARNYSGSGDWLDESGNGHDAQLGSGSGSDTNDPLFMSYTGTPYCYFPGTANNTVTVAGLSNSTTYDYTLTYDDGTTDTGSDTTDGSGNLVMGATDAKFAGLKVRSIVIVPDGGGATVETVNFADASEPFATFTGATAGKTITIQRSSSGLVSTVVDRDMFLLTTNDYFVVPDDAGLDSGADEDITLVAVFRKSLDTAVSRALVHKGVLTGNPYYLLRIDTDETPDWLARDTTGVVTRVATDSGALSDNTLYVVAGRRDSLNGFDVFVDGEIGATQNPATSSDWSNASDLYIGARLSASVEKFFEGQIVAVALFREGLTDLEVAQVGNLLVSGGAEDFVVTFAPLARW